MSVNGEEVNYLHEVSYYAIRDMAADAVYQIERYPTRADGTLDKSAEPIAVEITVPSRKARSIGLWMAPGKVTAIANDSIAANFYAATGRASISVVGVSVVARFSVNVGAGGA